MLHSLLITHDNDAAELLARLIRSSGQVLLDRLFCPEPSSYELTIALNTLALDVVFVDVSHPESAVSVSEQIRDKDATLAVVGFSTKVLPFVPYVSPTAFSLSLPLAVPSFLETVRDAVHASRPRTYSNVIAILPAKAGGGASTITVNVAAELARSFHKSVLMADCDLRSGTIADRLGLRPQQSICQTLGLADVASTLIWPRHVCRRDNIDFLLTDRDCKMCPPEWHNYYHLLGFLAPRYDHVLVDLPELVDDRTAEVLQSASVVYIMTTPELLSLNLARQRIADLEAVRVERSKVRILVNRWHHGDLHSKQISEILGCKVEAVFPNDYRPVREAILSQSFVEPKSPLGRVYHSFAGFLAGENRTPFDTEQLSSFVGSFRLPRLAALINRAYSSTAL